MKKKMTSAACVAAILFFCPFISKAQWTSTSTEVTLDATNINKDVVVEHTLFADRVRTGEDGNGVDLNESGIELGVNHVSGITTGISYVDFHYANGLYQDYNVRLINKNDGGLTLLGKLSINGDGVEYEPGYFNNDYSLAVSGGIICEKVQVRLKSTWPDYVFKPKYKLTPLSEVEKYIKENKHLPEMPSAETVYKDGVDLAAMDAKLLKKVEEMTLYMIELKKENEEMKKALKELQKGLNK